MSGRGRLCIKWEWAVPYIFWERVNFMKVVLMKSPAFFAPLLRRIFGIPKKK